MEKQFEIINIELSDFVQSCIGEKEGKVICHMYLDEYKHTEKTMLHAEVMNDALNVHFETGFNSSELLRQNREMREALEYIKHIKNISIPYVILSKINDCLTSCTEQGKE